MTRFNAKGTKVVVYALDQPVDPFQDFMSTVGTLSAAGANVIILSFLYYTGGTLSWNDCIVKTWVEFTASQRAQIKAKFSGGVILVSHGGASGSGAIGDYQDKWAQDAWDFVSKYDLDGLDFDYETLNPNVTIFAIKLGKLKPIGKLFTMAPQGSGSTLKQHITGIYSQISDSVDWLNIQYYNQTARFKEYSYTMYNQDDASYPSSVRGIITGKTITDIYCDPSRGTLSKDCDTGIQIPPYKIVIGGCISTQCTGTVSPQIILSFIQGALAEKRYNFSPWLKSGGMMIWEYYFSPRNNSQRLDNTASLSVIKKASSIFRDQIPTPTSSCDSIDCGIYGECDTGKCTCYWGTSGKFCNKYPECSDNVVGNGTPEQSKSSSKAPIIILGIGGSLLIVVGILAFIGIISIPIFITFLVFIILGTGAFILFRKKTSTEDKVCKNGGKIGSDGACICIDGWGGDECEKWDCSSKKECGAHGICDRITEGKCWCQKGWKGELCETPDEVVNLCKNGGTIGANGKCSCNFGWKGDFCEISNCPSRSFPRGKVNPIDNTMKCVPCI